VIGTGASAIQFVPRIRSQVAELQLYQRTAPWVMPHPDRPTTGLERAIWRAAVWAARESMVLGLTIEPRLMAGMEAIAKAHLRSQVPDRELRRKLTPDYRLGCKRILVSDEYYPALGGPGAELITGGVAEVGPHSIVGGDGVERAADTIIFGYRISCH
jgi:cation diffusion facilitator CzcD-associated flavoprotein CzcO